jgi:hypothetical protein
MDCPQRWHRSRVLDHHYTVRTFTFSPSPPFLSLSTHRVRYFPLVLCCHRIGCTHCKWRTIVGLGRRGEVLSRRCPYDDAPVVPLGEILSFCAQGAHFTCPNSNSPRAVQCTRTKPLVLNYEPCPVAKSSCHFCTWHHAILLQK